MAEASRANVTNVDLVRIKGIEYKSLIRPFPLAKVQEKYDYMLKLIIVGDSGVGKTNIISAFCNSDYHFAANHVPTIGVDFSVKVIQLQNKRVKLQVWDTAGQQRFRTITETYYKGAAGIFLVYSVGNRESFNNVKKWMQQINEKTGDNVQVVLIANKIDLPDVETPSEDNTQQNQGNSGDLTNNNTTQNTSAKQPTTTHTPTKPKQYRTPNDFNRVVSRKQGWDLAAHYGISYHEVSAKMNEKIDEIFYNMAEKINSELEEENNNKELSDEPQYSATYKISHSGVIELSTKGDKKTKIRSKKGIIYHKSEEGEGEDKGKKKTTLKFCKNC